MPDLGMAGLRPFATAEERLRRQWNKNVRWYRRIPVHLSLRDKLVVFASSGFGPGLLPLAPATFASFVAVSALFITRESLSTTQIGLIVLSATALAIALGGASERVQSDRDPKWFVLDEYAGAALVFLFNPLSLWSCLAGFLLFRLFDVLKSWPANRAEALPGGWGMVTDDLIAGVYAGAILTLGRALIALIHPA